MNKEQWTIAIIRSYMRDHEYNCTCGADRLGEDYHDPGCPWFECAHLALDEYVAEARERGKKILI